MTIEEEVRDAIQAVLARRLGKGPATPSARVEIVRGTDPLTARITLQPSAYPIIHPMCCNEEHPRAVRACGFCDTEHDAHCPKAMGCTAPSGPPNGRIVSSVRLEHEPSHDRLTVWNRGGQAGVLVVESGDGAAMGERLTGGMVQGRVNAITALESAARRLMHAADAFDELGINPTDQLELRVEAQAAYAAARTVEKEIGR